jgi:hypothetical protein
MGIERLQGLHATLTAVIAAATAPPSQPTL